MKKKKSYRKNKKIKKTHTRTQRIVFYPILSYLKKLVSGNQNTDTNFRLLTLKQKCSLNNMRLVH